jgi:hypothetical protein
VLVHGPLAVVDACAFGPMGSDHLARRVTLLPEAQS